MTTRLTPAHRLIPAFTPGEVLPAGTLLTIHGAANVDERSAQGAVHIVGRHGEQRAVVRTSPGEGQIGVDTSELTTGDFMLVVDELIDEQGERFAPLAVPFVIDRLRGKVSDELRVEHVVRLAIGELDVQRLGADDKAPTGTRWVEVVKAADRTSGAATEIAFDARGRRVDASDLFDDVAKRRLEKFGKLHETLYDHIESMKASDTVDVVLWPPIDRHLTGYDKPAKGAIGEPLAAQREQDRELAERAKALADGVEQHGGKITRQPDEDVPTVHATLRIRDLRRMALIGGVGIDGVGIDELGIAFLDDTSEVLDLGNSISVSRTNLAHGMGFDGTGVNVAVFESGPSDTTNLTFAGRFTTSPSASSHARLTSAVVRNSEPNAPHGHAPGCSLFSANSSSNDALRWAANQGCTVISQSFHRGTEPGGAGLQSDDVLKDWLALRWPYPTIVQAAGNFWSTDPDDIDPPSSEFVNHKGYNTLSVGNHNDTAGAMSADSVFRNPSSNHGDRELPEISANGTGVSAVGESKSGTSFAAPAAAGVTAVLQDVDATLRSWPEGCRAILLASSTRNVSSSTWWADVVANHDGDDGAGAIDAQAGVRVAQSRRSRNAAGVRRGWDVGTLRSTDFDGNRMSTFRYRVTVPRSLYLSRVKVALAWDSSVSSIFGIPLGSNLSVDFDLIVRDGNGTQVAHSSSWDNSYEIAEFVGTNGATYDIFVRRWSGTDDVWYGLAWNVEGITFGWPFGLSSGTIHLDD